MPNFTPVPARTFDDYLNEPPGQARPQTFDEYLNAAPASQAVPPVLRAPRQPQPLTLAQRFTSDALDAALAQRAGAQGSGDALDALLASRANLTTQPASLADQFEADARAGATVAAKPPVMNAPRVASPQNGMAQDLAAGGASPDTLTQLMQVGSAGAHGIGSMFNNAANFVERHLPFFPADIATRDTAIQAATDQQFAQNASPGEKAAAFVAPMLLPMSGAMAPGNALRSGIMKLAGNTAPNVGRVVGTVAGNALNGGLLATGASIDPSQPTGQQDMQHVLLGAGLGAGIPAAVSAERFIGSNLWNAAKPLLMPRQYVGQGLADALGDAAPTVASNIRSAPSLVPGSLPTTAQAAANPILVATEKAAANANPDFRIALAQREAENNMARWNAINGIAQSPLDLQNAQAARDTSVQALYNTAKQQDYLVDNPLTSILNRPYMKAAIDRAQTLANNKGAGPIMNTVGVPNMLDGSPTTQTTLTGSGAHYIKMALDDMLNPRSDSGIAGNAQGALKDTRASFMSWLESKSPEYAQARQQYSAASVPINTMEAGQQIADKLGGKPLNAYGAAQITPQGFGTALAQALKKQEFGIDPAAEAALNNVGADLQRATISNSLRSPGSDTAYNLAANGWLARNLYGPGFRGATPVGRGLAGLAVAMGGHPWLGVGLAGSVGKAGQMVGNRLNAQLSDLLLNPSGLLPYLDARASAVVNPAQPAFGGLLQRQVMPGLLGGVARGGLLNAQ